jgi:hypothetical protein
MFQDMKPQSGGSPTTQNRKYFGMTSQQVVILAGLAVAVILLLLVGGWLVLRGLPGSLAPVPQDTPVPQATATPIVIPTLTLTPTLTPVPYEMLIPEGWAQFKTALVELWLPKGFKSQKPKATDNPAASMTLDLEVVRPASKKVSLYPVIVLVTYEPLTVNTLDDYVEGLPAQLSTDVRVAAKRKVNINSVDAVLVLLEGKVDGNDINDQVYVFLDGSTVWFVHYMAQINDFYEMLPTFEQSIKTFRIVR